MKRSLFIVVVVLIFAIVGNFILNYHTTQEGAMDELNKKSDGKVIPLSDNTEALLIQKDGTVLVASSKVVRPLGWYKDFSVSNTDLNVYETDFEENAPYTHAPKTEGLSFGLIKSKQIESSSTENELSRQNTTTVFQLEDLLEDERLKNVKLWHSFILGEGDTIDDVLFFDKNKEVVEVEQEFIEK